MLGIRDAIVYERAGSELHKQAALYAEEHNQKLNAMVSKALEEYLAEATAQ